MNKIIALLMVAALAAGLNASAQTNDAATAELSSLIKSLIKKVQVKIQAGKTNETDFADELKSFDALIAAQHGATNEDVAQIAFMKAMLYAEVLDDTNNAAAIIRQIKANYPATRYGQNADRTLASFAKLAQAKAAQAAQDAMFAVGATFPDFAEAGIDGKPLSVGALKGKVVMVDFWATWCGPCRAELPNVIAAYKKHHGQGFEIIGVSLDSDREKLDAFLKKTDGMTWPQYFDGLGWQNKLAQKYGVQSIPFCVVVGADGKIIGKDLRGEELEAAVAGALAKK